MDSADAADMVVVRYVDSSTPGLAIAVKPAHIGHGAGSLMLARLLTTRPRFIGDRAERAREQSGESTV